MKPKPTRSLERIDEERVVPWSDGANFAWHRARYELALPYAAGRRVLDVGSGEGYGAALLATVARKVVGVDYSPAAISHASHVYERPNVSFRIADAAALPANLGSFDLVTAFELIEHMEDDEALLAGISSVLAPGGTALISTPNRLVERLVEQMGDGHYEYHVNSLTPRELRQRLRRHFPSVVLVGQSARGSPLHTLLKTIDVMNLRHRVVRSFALQQSLAGSSLASEPTFRFSRLLVRQSPITVARCRAAP